MRNEIGAIIDQNGLTGESHRVNPDEWYTPLNAFLSVGPPRQRIDQMNALMGAGVLDVLGPNIVVEARDGKWNACSPSIPDHQVVVTTLIEAHLPKPSLRNTSDRLLTYLRETGQCRPHSIDDYETGAVDVTSSPFHMKDDQGRAHARRFVVGVTTEGIHWVTTAGTRLGVNR